MVTQRRLGWLPKAEGKGTPARQAAGPHSHPVHVVVQLLEGVGCQLLLPLRPGRGLLLCGGVGSRHPVPRPLTPTAPDRPLLPLSTRLRPVCWGHGCGQRKRGPCPLEGKER